MAITTAATGVLPLLFCLWTTTRGLDLSDESYLLNWLDHPGSYPTSVSEFGFVYQPLMVLVGGNLIAARVVNVLLTWVLVVVAARLVLRQADVTSSPWLHAVAIGGLAPLSFHLGITTPGYNSLAFEAGALFVIALALMGGETPRRVWTGAVLAGLSGWLLLLAKPTTAVVAAVLGLVLLAVTRRLWRLTTAAVVGSGVFFVLLGAVLIDGWPGDFVRRIRGGADDLSILGSHTDLLRWDYLFVADVQRLAFGLVVVGIALAIAASFDDGRLGQVAEVVGALACVGAVVIFVRRPLLLELAQPGKSILLLGLAVGTVLGVLALHVKLRRGLDRTVLAWAIVLLSLPFATAVGSNNNYWLQMTPFAVWWVLGALVLLRGAGRPFLSLVTTVLLVGQTATVLLLVSQADLPYRQVSSLWDMDQWTRVGSHGSVQLDDEMSSILDRVTREARADGFEDDTPVIDLTGASPGVITVLGGKAVGSPWLLGGYPGSQDLALKGLRSASCAELARAWVLTEPQGGRAISGKVLGELGLDEQAYRDVVTWAPPQLRPPTLPRGEVTLAVPTDPEAARISCTADRQGS
ncbi:hypothetical protein ASD11_13850 [Aeromicrobium sp. Root495]|nr:hypothetical protein ASD11_13850 [Aeromicrobium sp. Root495]